MEKKMIIKKIILFLILFCKCVKAKSSKTSANKNIDRYLIELNLTDTNNPYLNASNADLRCTMYSKKCEFNLRISNGLNETWFDFFMLIENEKLAKLKSIQKCDSNYEKCLNLKISSSMDKANQFNSNTERFFLVKLYPKIVGKTNLKFFVWKSNVNTSLEHEVIVTGPKRYIDIIHQVYIVVFSTLIATIMGILLDMETIFKIVKMPIPVAIGFISQYLFMPLVTYAFIKLLKLSPVEALALFIYGCSPGGSGSNNWTILFNGDIDLSAIMTFVSTVSSLFMMPLWIFTLGSTLSRNAKIKIPVEKLILNILFTVIPCLIGLFLSQKFPKLKKIMIKITKRLVLFLILSFLLLTIWVKFYVFKLITWQQWVSGPLIPWAGFALGGFLAWLTRRPTKQIYTISIETGFQNVGIAFMITMLNFPSPESDYALLPLIAVTCLTAVPLWFFLFIKICRSYFTNRKKNKNSNANNNENNYEIEEKKNFIEENIVNKSSDINEVRNEIVKVPYEQQQQQQINTDSRI